MSRIRGGQLFTLLISIRMFSVICMTDLTDASAMAGVAFSTVVQILAAIPVIMLYRDSSLSLSKEMLFGRFGKLLYIFFFILWGAISFSNLWEVTKSVYFPIKSSFSGAVILGAVCVYTASLGIKAVFRASGLLTGLIAVSLIIMLVGAYPKADLANFVPDADYSSIIKAAVRDFSHSGEIVMMFILCDLVFGNRKKSVITFFATKLVLTELIAAVEITVLGKIINISDFPFFTAGAFSQPMSIQRADSVYMILFTLLCVMTITVQITLCTMLTQELLPDLKYKSLIITLLMLATSSALNVTQFDPTALSGILILILGVAIPVIMYIRRKINEDNKSTVTSASADNA